eukprot:1141683-Pelagomonas_calceolata.AAC.3
MLRHSTSELLLHRDGFRDHFCTRSSSRHSRARSACAASQLQRPLAKAAVGPLPSGEGSATPGYVRVCAQATRAFPGTPRGGVSPQSPPLCRLR